MLTRRSRLVFRFPIVKSGSRRMSGLLFGLRLISGRRLKLENRVVFPRRRVPRTIGRILRVFVVGRRSRRRSRKFMVIVPTIRVTPWKTRLIRRRIGIRRVRLMVVRFFVRLILISWIFVLIKCRRKNIILRCRRVLLLMIGRITRRWFLGRALLVLRRRRVLVYRRVVPLFVVRFRVELY